MRMWPEAVDPHHKNKQQSLCKKTLHSRTTHCQSHHRRPHPHHHHHHHHHHMLLWLCTESNFKEIALQSIASSSQSQNCVEDVWILACDDTAKHGCRNKQFIRYDLGDRSNQDSQHIPHVHVVPWWLRDSSEPKGFPVRKRPHTIALVWAVLGDMLHHCTSEVVKWHPNFAGFSTHWRIPSFDVSRDVSWRMSQNVFVARISDWLVEASISCKADYSISSSCKAGLGV